MLNIPLVVLLGVAAIVMVKFVGHKLSGVLVGVLFGLALASTPAGPPIINGVTSLSTTVVASVSAPLGGHR